MNSYQELGRTSKEFRDLAGDLMSSDMNTFHTALNFFKSFCEQNGVIQEILAPILLRDFDTDSWYMEAVSETKRFNFTLPTDRLDALKAVYDLLWHSDAYQRLMSYGHATMFTKNYNNQLRKVNDALTNLLIRYIIRQLEAKIEESKATVAHQSVQPMQQQTNHFHGPTNFANHSTSVTQHIENNTTHDQDLIAILREIIQNSNLPDAEKEDALETVEMIDEEVNKEKPAASKVEKLVRLLPHADKFVDLGGKVVNLYSAISKLGS